jgi:hypothetical protein
MAEQSERPNIHELTAEIVASYVGNNAVSTGDLPSLISNVFHHPEICRTARSQGAAIAGPGRANQQVDQARLHRVPGRRQEDEDAEALSGQALWHDTPGLPTALGLAA